MTKQIIDAKRRKIGRVASEVAHILLGKSTSDFKPNQVADVTVEIINAGQLDISPKKVAQKKYVRYSGYPGGIRDARLEEIIAKKGYADVLLRAVYGMLPNNKLRSKMMKNVTVVE